MVQGVILITGTLLFYSALAVVLFDSSSMNIFIAKTIIDRISMSIEDLSYESVLSTPTRAILPTKMCVKGVIVVIQ